MQDVELLRHYSLQGSQAAFSTLVARHVDMVYSAAQRQVRSPDLAREVTQAVFLDLARQGPSLRAGSHLGSWLYVVARRRAVDLIRRESRRQRREEAAVAGAVMNEPVANWAGVAPLLDEAIASLNEADRTAVIQRFFERKNFADIGRTFGASEEAAQKRVSRAVERLRGFFQRRGVAASAAGLAAALAPNAVQAAPAGLAAAVSVAVGSAAPALRSVALLKSTHSLAMTFAQKTAIAALVAAAITGGLYQRHLIRSRDQQIGSLKNQLAHTQDDLRQLARENAALARQTADLQQESAALASAAGDPLTADPTAGAMHAWLERVKLLKQRLAQAPEQRIPEFQFLTATDWLNAAERKLNTEMDFRRALAQLRSTAKQEFENVAAPALRAYLQATGGRFPSDLSQLEPLFASSVDPAILERYHIVPQSEIPNMRLGGDLLVTEKGPVDPEYDSQIVFGGSGSGSQGYPSAAAATLAAVLKSYAAANSGLMAADPAQLLPYATTAEQQAAVQKYIERSKR